MITVNESIAEAYRDKYGLQVFVVRNMPRIQHPVQVEGRDAFAEHGIPTDLPIALMQGAYMDRDRGAAEAVAALPGMKGVRLVLVGAGIEWEEASAMQSHASMDGRLHCLPKLPFEELRKLTASADVGLSLDKGGHGNYEMSLPNKLFDYLHAGVPVVCSDLPVAGRFVREEGMGVVAKAAQGEDAIARSIAEAVGELLDGPPESEHLAEVAQRHHWGAHTDTLLGALHRPG